MKALSFLLATVSGAGFLFHNQLHSWWNSPRRAAQGPPMVHQAPEGVYYLRTACYFVASNGAGVRWSAGQELRTAGATMHGIVTLTDGLNTWQVPQSTVTRDMDDAAALRQTDLTNQNLARAATEQEAARKEEAARQASAKRLVSGQFHSTTLDASPVRTNQPENIVSTAGAPVFYSVYVPSGAQQSTGSQGHKRASANMVIPRNQANKNFTGAVLTTGQ